VLRYKVIREPDVRGATEAFRRLLERIVRKTAHAIEAELVELSPGRGNLIDAWEVAVYYRKGWPVGLVINRYSTDTGIPIMVLLEYGSGLWGPKGKVIRPKRAKALRFEIDGEVFFRKWVRGIDPAKHAFVDKALEAADSEIKEIIARETKDWRRK